MKKVLKPWKMIPALLALVLALAGCLDDGVHGGGTEAEGLSGIVVDPGGKAVANARVLVLPDTGSALAKRFAAQAAVLDSARTDSKGRYRIDSLPAGTYLLLAGTVRNDTVLTVLVRGIVHDGGERDLGVLTLKVGGSISVTIRSDGQAVADARCSIAGLSALTTVSTINGTCLLSGLPLGTYRVTVTHPTLGSGQTEEIEVEPGRIANGGRVDLVAGGPEPIDTTAPGPNTFEASGDALIWGSVISPIGALGERNAGKFTELNVGVFDRNTICRSLIQTDLPASIQPERISKAVLRITSKMWISRSVHPTTVTIRAHRLLKSWKEGNGSANNGVLQSETVDGVTNLERFWGSQNASEDWSQQLVGLNDVDAAAAVAAFATRDNGYLGTWEFDVTALAKTWALDPSANFGVVIEGDIPSTDALTEDYPVFHSREAAVAESLRPHLVLTLTGP